MSTRFRCASAPAVRNIYGALYGVSDNGTIDPKKALLSTPQQSLPKINPDGGMTAPKVEPYEPPAEQSPPAEAAAAPVPVTTTGRRD